MNFFKCYQSISHSGQRSSLWKVMRDHYNQCLRRTLIAYHFNHEFTVWSGCACFIRAEILNCFNPWNRTSEAVWNLQRITGRQLKLSVKPVGPQEAGLIAYHVSCSWTSFQNIHDILNSPLSVVVFISVLLITEVREYLNAVWDQKRPSVWECAHGSPMCEHPAIGWGPVHGAETKTVAARMWINLTKRHVTVGKTGNSPKFCSINCESFSVSLHACFSFLDSKCP